MTETIKQALTIKNLGGILMTKKILCAGLSLILVLSLAACSGEEEMQERSFDSFANAIDTEYSEAVMTGLSQLGDDPITGNRSAGSPAEHEAAEFLEKSMKDIGLSRVTADEATVDGWTFKGADLTYKDAAGQEVKVVLGGYATQIKAKKERLKVVYLGKGTAADYEGRNVRGKLVLIDIDQENDWWINYPAYQAKLKGAKAVIALSTMTSPDENRLTSQDICGPREAPALSISQKDSLALRERIAASPDHEISVVFNADSTVKKDRKTYNVWGEIPGKTDDVIYLIGHYDGYYHSSFDNASGIATCLGIAKAVVDSGEVPDKTIRVVAHGAEEWGRIDSAYDWSAGAYQQIMKIHPEWVKKAFALINIDGCYPVAGEMNFGIRSSYELQKFTREYTEELVQASGYNYAYDMPAGVYTEDFIWTLAGIPSIIASEGEGSIYYDSFYHSSTDSVASAGFDPDAFRFNHVLFGQILLNLDALAVRPMDFTARFEALEDSLDPEIVKDPALTGLIEDGIKNSKAINKKIKKLNDSYVTAIARQDSAIREEDQNEYNEASEEIRALRKEAAMLNDALSEIYKKMQDDLVRIDWGLETVFPHENPQNNMKNLSAAVNALESGNLTAAYEEFLPAVEYNCYVPYFDRETCEYFVKQIYNNSQGTFGEGRMDYPGADLSYVMRSLKDKNNGGRQRLDEEIAALQAEYTKQNGYLTESLAKERASLAKIETMMEKLNEK